MRKFVGGLIVAVAALSTAYQGNTQAAPAAAVPATPAAKPLTPTWKKGVGTAKAGEAIFLKRCFACHSVVEGETRFGPSLYHEMKVPKPKKDEAAVRSILFNGKNKMPVWKDILTADDVNNIVAYLKTL